ncbi:Uncharacterised protein [Legionella busanensis]|uniref:Uncharacterized protein n=1 Tax=Legionella busanensis TaxID=190655 RepID=A0A378JLB3_9GAMM|nr:hypothetical protein [Legionella busanensis]STX51093.1 Uncharacterised protein [Legionella busanensis]
MIIKKIKIIAGLFLLSCLIYTDANAWYGGWYFGNRHYHDYDAGFGFSYGWLPIPNIVINIPVQREYYPVCETFEVCDEVTDECWLEKQCR